MKRSLLLLMVLIAINLFPASTFAQFAPVEWQQVTGPYGGRYWDLAEDPGTGYIWSRTSNKIYFSTDRGESWIDAGLEDNVFGGFAFRSDGTVFAGQFWSEDGGASWQRVNLPDSVSIRSLAFHNFDSTLVAATKYGIYSSDDDGENWQLLTRESVKKVWSVNDLIMALTDSSYPVPDILIQSKDHGSTWSELLIPSTGEVKDFMRSADGAYFLLMYDNRSAGNWLYSSSNFDEPWELLSTEELGRDFLGMTPEGELIILFSPRVYSYSLETNQASMIYEAPDREVRISGSRGRITSSMLASDGALYMFIRYSELIRTDDFGATLIPLDGSGIKETIVDHIVVDEATGNIWAGTSDYGVFLSSDQGETWTNRGFFTYSLSALSVGDKPGELWAATYQDGLFRSMDSGENWHFFESDSIDGRVYDFYYDEVADIRYALLHGDIYFSKDQGESWTGMNAPRDNNVLNAQPVEGFTVGPDGGIYARILFNATAGNHGIFRTSDLGATWKKVHEGSFDRPWRSKLMFDSSGTLWLGENDFLYKSFDNGVTWEEVLSFQTRITSLLETPDGSLWMGHEYGLMRSVDGGNTWRDEQENLHNGVLSLAWNETTSELLAGTGGGGIYRGYIDTSIRVGAEESREFVTQSTPLLIAYPNPVIDAARLVFTLERDTPVRLLLMDQLGRQVSELLHTHVVSGTHEIAVDFSKMAPGVYFYRLETEEEVQSRAIIRIK